jgi:hypothetical protein
MMASHPDRDSLLTPPAPEDRVAFRAGFGPRFLLVVDTEEEFDWNAPFSRASTSVTLFDEMARGQAWFAAAGIRPVYVTDWPVLESAPAAAMLAQWVADGAAEVGAHLHPWVNPPHHEAVNAANSYVGSLPEALEREKLAVLRDGIAARIGVAPRVYRAGRYGVGPNSGRLLKALGFRVDTSIRSRFDYAGQHGPDFTGMPLHPWWAGPDRALMELPLSTAFTGLLRGAGERLFRAGQAMGPFGGALARAGLLSRVPLTPEGVPASEAIRAIDALLEEGVPILNFSFHSPTLGIGHTPYVRDAEDLRQFYAWWDRVVNHLTRRGVQPAAIDAILAAASPGEAKPCQAARPSAIAPASAEGGACSSMVRAGRS